MMLNRYIAKELLVPLLLTCALTVFGGATSQLIRLASEVTGLGISLWDLFTILPLVLPTFLGMGLPIAYLLSLLIAFGRLSEDRELIALSAAGVPTARLLVVPLLLGVVLTGLGLVMTLWAEGSAIRQLKESMVDSAARYFADKLEPAVIHDDLPEWMIYYAKKDKKTDEMRDVVVTLEQQEKSAMMVLAERGRIHKAQGSRLVFELKSGEVQLGFAKDAQFRRIRFERFDLQLDVWSFVRRTVAAVPEVNELSAGQLFRLSRDPERSERDRQRYAATFHRKLTFPLANLVFVLVVFPLTTVLSKQSRLKSYLLAALCVAGYFVLSQATTTLTNFLHVSTALACWLPNIVFGALGVVLTWRRVRV